MRSRVGIGEDRQGRKAGQALVEFTFVLVIFLLLVSGVADFGLMFARQISVVTAARAGARWAAIHPTSWSNSAGAPSNTIEGQVQAAGAFGTIPNDDTHIQVTYLMPTGSTPVECGRYSSGSNQFVAMNGYSQATCVLPGTMVQVQVTVNYPFATPLLSRLFGVSLPIGSTAAMLEES